MTSSPSGIDNRLRFEWEASQARSGRPVIEGFLMGGSFEYRTAWLPRTLRLPSEEVITHTP